MKYCTAKDQKFVQVRSFKFCQPTTHETSVRRWRHEKFHLQETSLGRLVHPENGMIDRTKIMVKIDHAKLMVVKTILD